MKISLNILIGLLLSFTTFIRAQNESQVLPDSGITGTWTNSDYGYTIIVKFNPDGSGEIDGKGFVYTLHEDRLSVKAYEKDYDYHFQLEGNNLTLSGGDLPNAVIFIRADGSEYPDASMESKEDEALIGTWSGNGEQIEFSSGGLCIYLGERYSYMADQGELVIITAHDENIIFQYSIAGDQLTFSANGQSVIYTRGEGTISSSPSTNPRTGYIEVAQELVGDWCWIDVNNYNEGVSMSSRCITLNADGTYVYNSESSRSVNSPDIYGGLTAQDYDSGTWYLEGDRLYYTSDTQGPGSYKLEKRNHPRNISDPMIVLNGEAFVTKTQRPAWK